MSIAVVRWVPVGAATTTDWELEGSNYVDSILDQGNDVADDTYVFARTSLNQAVEWTLSDDSTIPASATISSVKIYTVASRQIGSNMTVKLTVDGVAQSAVGYAVLGGQETDYQTFTTNPGTGLAWTRAQVFSTEFGAKITAITDTDISGQFRIYKVYALVTYVPAASGLSPSSVINPGFDTVMLTGGVAFAAPTHSTVDGSSPLTTLSTGTYVVLYDPNSLLDDVWVNATVLSSTSLSFVAPVYPNQLVDVHVVTYRSHLRGESTVDLTGASGLTFATPTADWWLLANPTDDAVGATGQYEDVDGGSPKVTINWYYYGYQPDGRWTVTTAPASDLGWWFSTESYGGASTVVLGGQPGNPRSFTEVPSAFSTVFGGSPGIAVTYNNRLIYAKGGYTVGTDYPTLRTFDGQSDRVSATIPPTSAGVIPKTVMSMLAANGTIYVSTLDTGASSADWAGRVFSFDPISGQLAQIGAGFTGGNVPYALAWHSNRLWVGSNKGDGSAGTIYFIRPGIDTAWTTDYTLATSTVGGATSMLSYKGALLIGTDNAAAAFAKVLKRAPAGTYTTTDTGTGGTARVNNGFYSMCEFGGNLYTGYFNNDSGVVRIAKIRKYDGTTWTTAYTGATTTLVPYIGLFSEGTNLYAIGGGLALAVALLRTPDGTTWTDVSTYLSGSSTGIPAFGTLVL